MIEGLSREARQSLRPCSPTWTLTQRGNPHDCRAYSACELSNSSFYIPRFAFLRSLPYPRTAIDKTRSRSYNTNTIEYKIGEI